MMTRVHISVSWSSRLVSTLVVMVALGLGAASVRAATLTVDTTTDATHSPNDCSTGAGTSCSLRDAITQANNDKTGLDTIVFKSDVTGTIKLGSSLPQIDVNVTITGPGANLLTLDGGGTVQEMTIGNSQATPPITPTVSISGLTFANGSGNGGAILVDSAGTLNLSKCVFSNNSGGAIESYGALTVTGSTFMQNSSLAEGGAIFESGTLTATNNTFDGNSAGGHDGGAIFIDGYSASIITNNTFVGNAASTGGAIYLEFNNLTAENNLFDGNSGGAIVNAGSGALTAGNNVYYGNGGTNCTGNGCASNPADAASNPLTLPLGNYGGPTETYLPQPGSAAICAGSSSATGRPSTDQRGWPMNTACVDAGSVQTNYIQVQASGDAGAGSTDCPGTKCTLRDAVSQANTNGYGDIDFQSSFTSITLGSAVTLSGTTGINIIGPAANKLTINANISSNAFTVDGSVPAVLYGMTVANGFGNRSANGGGIVNSGNLTLDACAVANNSAGPIGGGGSGGGIYNSGSLLVLDSTISGNNATIEGGGIYSSGTLEMVESTVAGNQAIFPGGASGGGVYSDIGSTLAVVNSTIAGNSVSGGGTLDAGGGLYLHVSSASLANTIVSGNTSDYAEANLNPGYADNGGNVIGGNTNATNNLVGGTGAAITLSPLALTGPKATVQTLVPEPGGTSGNPAICGGLSSNLPATITTDERGQPISPNDCPSGSVDAGAVQTSFSMSFTTEPPSSLTANQTFGAAVTLDESGHPFTAGSVNIPVTLSSGTLYGNTIVGTSSGVATYSGLIATAGSGLTLNAALELNGGLATPLSISATSTPFTVAQATTSASVVSSSASNTSTLNNPVTFTATVTAAAGDTIPISGTVLFTDNGNPITSCGASGAVTIGNWNSTTGTATASCTTSALIGGNHSIVATYDSNTSYTGSNNNLTQIVNPVNTTTTASSNPATASINQGVTLSATVTPNGQPVPLTGPLTFTENGNAVPGCTVAWDASTGTATCTTSQLPLGPHTITATYPADVSYNTSSNQVAVKIGAATGTMVLSSSNLQATSKSTVTFTASFTVPTGSTKPSGQIAFSYTPSGSSTATAFSGCSAIGLTSTSGGSGSTTYSAQCTSSSLATGTYAVTATYINDNNFSISPATLTQTISPPVVATVQVMPASTVYGTKATTLMATVAYTGTTAPTGAVTFAVNGGAAMTGACTGSSSPLTCTASYPTATLAVSGTPYAIVASLAADTNYQPATATGTLVISQAGSAVSITSSTANANLNANVTFTAMVTSQTTGTPTGSVEFLDGSTVLGSGPLNNSATATYTTSKLTAGLHQITAVYQGDNNFDGSTSTPLAQIVTAPNFGLMANVNSLTLKDGQTGTVMISMDPVGGFNGSVQFSCSGLPANSKCTFLPTSLTADGSNKAQTDQMTITTQGPNSGTVAMISHPGNPDGVMLAGIFWLPGLLFGGLLFWQRKKLTAKYRALLIVLVVAATISGVVGCGSTPIHTAPGSSLVTVTATNGTTTHTATIEVTVTQ